ncbi:MAG: sigma-70 region 4 domain-containing protein, partial [Bacteroidota bacterium]
VDQASYDELLAIVRKLPPAYRTVFNLYAIEGYGHKEIATLLGISEGTSKSNYAKAKKKLQAYLDIFFELELKS